MYNNRIELYQIPIILNHSIHSPKNRLMRPKSSHISRCSLLGILPALLFTKQNVKYCKLRRAAEYGRNVNVLQLIASHRSSFFIFSGVKILHTFWSNIVTFTLVMGTFTVLPLRLQGAHKWTTYLISFPFGAIAWQI